METREKRVEAWGAEDSLQRRESMESGDQISIDSDDAALLGQVSHPHMKRISHINAHAACSHVRTQEHQV